MNWFQVERDLPFCSILSLADLAIVHTAHMDCHKAHEEIQIA